MRTGVGAASRNRLGFGCGFADMNLDGALDLVVANGHIDETVRSRRTGVGHAQPPLLLLNQGNGTFVDRAAAAGEAFAQPRVARGLAFGDFDNDGDVDVLMTTNNGPAVLFRNDQTAGNRSVRFTLQGTTSNRDGIGATVRIHHDGIVQSRMVKSGSSYLSQSELPRHLRRRPPRPRRPRRHHVARWPHRRVQGREDGGIPVRRGEGHSRPDRVSLGSGTCPTRVSVVTLSDVWSARRRQSTRCRRPP